MRELPKLQLELAKPEAFGNVAAKLTDDERRQLASDLIELVHADEVSMSDWLGEAQGYLDAASGDMPPSTRTSEDAGADEGPPPSSEMTLSAVIQFSARATDALLGEPDLAKASSPGGEKLAAWVSTQLRTNDPNWTLDTDPLVIHMGVTGLAWRKRDFDDADKVFHSHFLPCTDVIVNKNVRAIERAPRITQQFQRYPYEIERSIERGKWIDYDPKFNDADPQAPKNFYETDAWLDLDGDGIDEPWTFVISRDDHQEVVRIRPRWSRKTISVTDDELYFNPIRRFYPYRFLPDPKGGFFPIGFGKLLSRTENTADRLLAAILETAESEAENGGILAGGGFGLPDKIEIKNNRITTVGTDGAKLSDHFQAFPTKSVSQGSVTVLEKVMTMGDRLAGTLNLMESAPASMTATMARGIIDTGTQVQSAVHRRVVASMTQEFRMFVQMANAYDMLPDDVTAADSDAVAVTADPQMATEMQRAALAGLYKEMLEAPHVYNPQVVGLRLLQVMRVPNPEELMAAPAAPQATPWEKMQGAIGLMKQKTESMKATAAVAVQLTQALKNMVDAHGGMQDNRAGLLAMAQLEQAVQALMQDSGNVGTGLDGMAQQPGNQAIAGPAPQPQGGGAPELPGGPPGGPGDAGAGSGLA